MRAACTGAERAGRSMENRRAITNRRAAGDRRRHWAARARWTNSAAPVPAAASRNLAIAAVLFFVIACASWTLATQHFGSSWVKTGAAYGVNSLLGYSETERVDVVHKENRSFLQQISMFAGATTDVSQLSPVPGFALATTLHEVPLESRR